MTCTDLIPEFEDFIKCATDVSVSVTVSSICPRSRGDEVTDSIKALNAGLKVSCDDLGVQFMDNDPSFHLQDGSRNDGYLLPDGVHLTRAATNKLVTNLTLDLRHGAQSAHIDHRRRQYPRAETADPKPFNHSFWQRARQKATRGPSTHGHHQRARGARSQHQALASPATTASRSEPLQRRSSDSPGPQRPPNQAAPQQPPLRPLRSTNYQAGHALQHPLNVPKYHSHGRPAAAAAARQTQGNFKLAPGSLQENAHCQLCLGSGHSAIVCKSKDSVCFKCNQWGHFPRACIL